MLTVRALTIVERLEHCNGDGCAVPIITVIVIMGIAGLNDHTRGSRWGYHCAVTPVASADMWSRWAGERRNEPCEHMLFPSLTIEPDDGVRPIHSKVMPAILIPRQ
jgi:putative SOS response-associated peptidase YedK